MAHDSVSLQPLKKCRSLIIDCGARLLFLRATGLLIVPRFTRSGRASFCNALQTDSVLHVAHFCPQLAHIRPSAVTCCRRSA